jgi:hypothetical protein
MPDAFARGRLGGSVFRVGKEKLIADWLGLGYPGSCAHPRLNLRLTPAPALVAHAQGGLTLGLERGELAADICTLGNLVLPSRFTCLEACLICCVQGLPSSHMLHTLPFCNHSRTSFST